ncbi:MAG: hypothetical protein K2I95_09545 [Treponemataceae bacterium]|nr:hypothetical protein [Treponemataceae bacterium]
MGIFRIFRADAGTTKFCKAEFAEDSLWHKESLFRNRYRSIHEVPIVYCVKNKCKPEDYPSAPACLVSPRFCGLIKKLNKNVECFESVIKYAGKEKDLKDKILYDDFYTLVFPEYELFNWDASEYVSDISFDGRRIVTDTKKIVLDRNKLNAVDDNFFALKEKSTKFLCTEMAKDAIENAGLTGIGFEELETA